MMRFLVLAAVIFCLPLFLIFPAVAGVLQTLETVMTAPAQLANADRFDDPTAPLGVAFLDLGGITDFSGVAPLGGVEADTLGNFLYLALNGSVGVPAADRMYKFTKPSITHDVSGLVDTAVVGSPNFSYLTNTLLSTIDGDNPKDHSVDYILGMGIDRNTNDLYSASQDGVGGVAVMRYAIGVAQAGDIIEFAEPSTVPQPLTPNWSPAFADVLMGPEAVAFHRQPDATDLFFFTDGTASDYCIAWAVQDLPFVRSAPAVSQIQNLVGTPDANFFTDELRLHANVLAGNYAFDPLSPTIHSDIVYLPVANQMIFSTGRQSDSGLFLVDDLNDNREIGQQSNPDIPQVKVVLNFLSPSCMANVYNSDGSLNTQQIIVANYISGATETTLVRVAFNSGGNVVSAVQLNLTTPNDALPGRISEIATDSDGNIYAVDGAGGFVYVIAPNQSVPTPTPIPPANFSCFETMATVSSANGNFTPETLVQYVSVSRGEADVITELELLVDGNLDDFLPRKVLDIRRFYYVNRPLTLSELDQLTVTNGDWFIFKSDGDQRAFLEVRGKLKSDTVAPQEFRPDYMPGFDDPEEAEVRYSSVVGFISWMKRQGVTSFLDLAWTAPGGDVAAIAFEAFAGAVFGAIPADADAAIDVIDNNLIFDEATRMFLGVGENSGRWAGIYFHNSDPGTGPTSASNVQHSRIEFAEVGIYAQDDEFDQSNIRNENALRVLDNTIERCFIGLSLDGYSPVVATNDIRNTAINVPFGNRNFGGATPHSAPCSLNTSQRFPIGETGVGVYITKRRLSSQIQVDPLFFNNRITGNAQAGVWIQQPGVSTSFGTASVFNQPKPLFGRLQAPVETAHEFSNSGQNGFASNGFAGDPRNFVYNVREVPNDNGDASFTDPSDMGASGNGWEDPDTQDILASISDGRGLIGSSDRGEIIIETFQGFNPSSVEGSTELYE